MTGEVHSAWLAPEAWQALLLTLRLAVVVTVLLLAIAIPLG